MSFSDEREDFQDDRPQPQWQRQSEGRVNRVAACRSGSTHLDMMRALHTTNKDGPARVPAIAQGLVSRKTPRGYFTSLLDEGSQS